MEQIKNMPAASIIVIAVILALFALAVVMLLAVCAAYRRQARFAAIGDSVSSRLMHQALDNYTEAYEAFGQDVNTPAIIAGAVNNRMGAALFCERFLNNAVSLFVTLGLFGTFLGLSMSVSSLTELISFSNGSEWLGVLDSVGGGLMSALSGMGVAFYTSLVGVACSIILTLLRAIFSPDTLRSAMENEMELWLDHKVAPRLSTNRCKDDSELVNKMIVGLNAAADSMDRTLKTTTAALQGTLNNFNGSVDTFNKGIRDFAEVDYDLRGTVERMDVALRGLSADLRRTGTEQERSERI